MKILSDGVVMDVEPTAYNNLYLDKDGFLHRGEPSFDENDAPVNLFYRMEKSADGSLEFFD